MTEVDKVGKRLKIHYVEFSEQCDEWRPCGSEGGNNLSHPIEPLPVPSSTCLGDRVELVHGELHREIKRKLYSSLKDDPATRVRYESIRLYNFDTGLAIIVVNSAHVILIFFLKTCFIRLLTIMPQIPVCCKIFFTTAGSENRFASSLFSSSLAIV